jgi:uncharacterized membrane protein
VFLISTVKFVFGGVPVALGLGFSFFETVVVTTLGGFTGVIIFVTLSDSIIKRVKSRKLKKEQEAIKTARKKIFSRKNRFIIHVKHRFGLFGIAALTPLLFSIPVGCFLATRYFKDKQRILIYMFTSILFWSISASSFRLLWG